MFASLKNKIKEETGNEIPSLSQPSSSLSTGGLISSSVPSSSSSSSSSASGTSTSTAASRKNSISSNNNNNQPQQTTTSSNNRLANLRSRLSSSSATSSSLTTTQSSTDDQILEQKDAEINSLRTQCTDSQNEIKDLKTRLDTLTKENERLEKTNEILLESVKVAQTQKDLITEEQEKIQNLQQAEITKLKSLLSFREQEAYDQLSKIKQYQQQIENLTTELERIKLIEPAVEDLQDELERLRHAAQLDKNNLTTTLAAVEEENRHLKARLQIIDQSRLESILSLSSNEKVQALIQERKLLEQHLEEAHLQLSDIKSSWSGQNLALETQVSRLSRQVAEETTEKRKAIKERDEYIEKCKQFEFELQKSNDEIEQRNTKIKLLEEEIDELTSAIRECREENEQEIAYLKNKAESSNQEIIDLKLRLESSNERFNEYVENSEISINKLRKQIDNLQDKLNDIQIKYDKEIEEKNIALLRNAEISQNEEILKKELRLERDECNDLQDKLNDLQCVYDKNIQEIKLLQIKINELNTVINNQNDHITKYEKLNNEINEKNKTIKILNQRLVDMKKTLQQEIKCSNSSTTSLSSCSKDNNIDFSLNTTNSNSILNDKLIMMDYHHNNQLINNHHHHQQQQQQQQQQHNHHFNNINYSHINISSTSSSINNGNSGGPIVMDEVNFKYLKHVIVKFLTSREIEARHLIRAVATLLHLTNEEEKLLHDTLNWKMSWFGTKPDHGSGQRAFSIPPS